MVLEIINKVLTKLGFQLQRICSNSEEVDDKPLSFYRPAPSCQIPELATLYSLFLGERKNGLFVEVGAFDGISFSNSSCLAKVGWQGVLIEPVPQFAQACRDFYRDNERISVIETAVGATNSTIEIALAGALTTANSNVYNAYKDITWAKNSLVNNETITVPQQKLDDILGSLSLQKAIDVLIVDVEGNEKAVFEGFSLANWMPRMIIAELAHTHPELHSVSAKDADLQCVIESHGYSVIYKDHINTVFLAR